MKKIILLFIVLLPILCKSQAFLNSTIEDIKAVYPNNVFKYDNTKDGTMYAYSDMSLGIYYYYFDKKTKLTYFCIQVPFDIISLNNQVEIYNTKYVSTSKTSWTAYLEGGAIMYIKLIYDKDYQASVFTYSNIEK